MCWKQREGSVHPKGWVISGGHQQRTVEPSGQATPQLHSVASWCQDEGDSAEVEETAISKYP